MKFQLRDKSTSLPNYICKLSLFENYSNILKRETKPVAWILIHSSIVVPLVLLRKEQKFGEEFAQLLISFS